MLPTIAEIVLVDSRLRPEGPAQLRGQAGDRQVEAAVGLAILISLNRDRQMMNVDEINLLKW